MDKDLEQLRQDIEKVKSLTADITRRLDALEMCKGAPTPAVPAAPETFPEEGIAAWGDFPEDSSQKAQTLCGAVKQGDLALAKHLIAEGADPNEIVGGTSALSMAIEAGHLELVELLVANGAMIEHAVFGQSPIRKATLLGHHQIASFLRRELNAKSERVHAESPTSSPVTRPVPESSVLENLWGMLAAGPIGQFTRQRIEEVRARTREIGWEAQLGTYWLPRVAVVCIAIAVVFFLTLAIERWGSAWMPHLRVAIGYAVCAALLVLAWRSESKYAGLARVLYGGGFAVMYFVTFATHYVRFARLFASSTPTLILLALVVIAWAIVAQLRQSTIIAVLVTALGHLTVMLSTLTLGTHGSASMMGLVALSAGSAFFLLRNRWYYVASLGLVGSYLNDFLALAHGHAGNPYTDFAGSMGVLTLFFLVFALSELFAPEDLRTKTIPSWFRNAFVTFNSAAMLGLGSTIMGHFEFTRHRLDAFFFVFAAVLMLLGVAYLRVRARDPLFNVYFVKAVTLATLGLATRYGGDTLSACLAIEMVVLLFSARRSGLIVIRLLAFAVAAVAFLQSFGVGAHMALHATPSASLHPGTILPAVIGYASPQYWMYVVRFMSSVLAFLLASQLYQRTNWRLRSPRPASLPPHIIELAWHLDLSAEPPSTAQETPKLLNGLLFPYVYALGGTILFTVFVFVLAHEGDRFAVMAVFALVMTIAATFLGSRPFGLAATGALLIPAFAIGNDELLSGPCIHLPVAFGGLVAMAAVALTSEDARVGKHEGLAFHQTALSPYALYGACAWLTGLVLIAEFPGVNAAFGFAVAVAVTAGLCLLLHAMAFSLISGAYMLAASFVFIPHVAKCYQDAPNRLGVAAAVLVSLSLVADRYFTYLRSRILTAPYLAAGFVMNACILLLWYVEFSVQPEWRMAVTVSICYGFLVYAVLFRSPAAVAVAVASVLYASIRHALNAFDATSVHPGLVAGFVLLAAFWLLSERLYVLWLPRYAQAIDTIKRMTGRDLNRPENALAPIALTSGLLIVFLNRLPHWAHANLALITISWFVLAAALFMVSLVFRQHFYRYAGLAVILLSLGRLFLVDMKEQDPLLRVAAFAVLGAGLLCISVGYYKWMARVRLAKADIAAEGFPEPTNDAR